MSITDSNELRTDACFISTHKGFHRKWLPGEYVRDIEGIEYLYASKTSMKYNSDNIIQTMSLQSEKEITPELIQKGITYLMKKYPVLHLCMGKKKGAKGLRVMDNPVMNFETIQGDPMEVYHRLIRYKYDYYNGPLWKICLVYPTSSKYEVVIIFSIFHIITDARTNVILQNDMLQMMNKTLKGEPIEINPVGFDSYVMDNRRLPVYKYSKALVDASLETVARMYNHGFPKLSHIFMQLHKTKLVDGTTKILFGGLSQEKTGKLFSLCKKNGVTVNSLFVAACAYSLVETTESKSKSGQEKHEILVAQAVDIRRYYKPEFQDSLGAHVSIINTSLEVPTDAKSELWEKSQGLNKNMKQQLSDGIPLKRSSLIKSYIDFRKFREFRSIFGKTPMVDFHFVSTNMGNLDKYFKKECLDDNIKLVNVLRTTNKEYGSALINLTFHTFRNRLLYSFDTFPTLIDEVDSANWFKAFTNHLEKIVE